MKIPSNLSYLSNATLVITAGSLDAKLYVLENGRVVEHEEVKKERPTYSDREEFFGRTGARGQLLASGSVHEDIQEGPVRKAFLKDLTSHIRELSKDHAVEKVLFFSPPENFKETKKAVPVSLHSKIAYETEGSFYKRPVLELLKKADASLEKKSAAARKSMAKGDARKILGRPGKA